MLYSRVSVQLLRWGGKIKKRNKKIKGRLQVPPRRVRQGLGVALQQIAQQALRS